MAGEWAAETFGDTPTNMVVLEGTTGSAPANDRAEGFDEAIAGTATRRSTRRRVTSPVTVERPSWRASSRCTGSTASTWSTRTTTTWHWVLSRPSRPGGVPGEDIQIVSIDAVHDGMQALIDGKINYIVECNPSSVSSQQVWSTTCWPAPRSKSASRGGSDLHPRAGRRGTPRSAVLIRTGSSRVDSLRVSDRGRFVTVSRSGASSWIESEPVTLAADAASSPIVEMRGITISFPGVLALDNVDFFLRPGEVHSLMGENGAGKSTSSRL